MSWVRFNNGRLVYTGRLRPPESFDKWAEGAGKPLITAMAARRRFAIFGAARATKRDLWAALRADAESGALAEGIAAAVSGYLPTIAEVATLPVDLPRVVVSLRRVVVVPRVVCVASLVDYISAALEHVDATQPHASDPVREYFSNELLATIDDAVMAAASDGHSAVAAGNGWVIIDADHELTWWVPPSGASERRWRGHYVLYEAPREKLSRAARKDLGRRIADLNNRVEHLSPRQRQEMVTQARGEMRELTARAFRRAAM